MRARPGRTAAAGVRPADDADRLPVDPDLPFGAGRRAPWPRWQPDVVAVVFLGGSVGGYARYAVGRAWSTGPDGFPAAILVVNLVGAFVLALVVVVAGELRPSRYLRPLLGTGFCGGLTTFSSVVVVLAQLLGHGRYALAGGYLAATTAGGLAAAALGLVLARWALAGRRPHGDDEHAERRV